MKTIFCKKFKQELEALEKPPTFGEVGKLAYENLSKDAWKLWLTIQAIMINERKSDLASSDDTVMQLNRQFKRFLESSDLENDYLEKLKLQDVRIPDHGAEEELFYEVK